ncbi:hypothetical protein L2E82_20645 [Cichorium intybus]|uniref:Uncharacterized protein n=1 Tax=Cichorium intybus TaxID=13427 RepID=A0ACB9DU89_CICIN|nr:hypothetical protein L2E82_20645 [Cichorium intybus]
MHGCRSLSPEMEMLIAQLFIHFVLGLGFKHSFFLLLSRFLAGNLLSFAYISLLQFVRGFEPKTIRVIPMVLGRGGGRLT